VGKLEDKFFSSNTHLRPKRLLGPRPLSPSDEVLMNFPTWIASVPRRLLPFDQDTWITQFSATNRSWLTVLGLTMVGPRVSIGVPPKEDPIRGGFFEEDFAVRRV